MWKICLQIGLIWNLDLTKYGRDEFAEEKLARVDEALLSSACRLLLIKSEEKVSVFKL